MKHLLTILLALACTTLHAQTVIVKGTDAGAVHRSGTGAWSVRGYVAYITTNTYCDGRFEVRSDNTNVVIDNDSGLMWTRNANIDGTKDWTNAISYCSGLTHATHSDWRLSSVAEFSRDTGVGTTTGLVYKAVSTNDPALPLGHPFTDVQSDWYWTSTESGSPSERASSVSLTDGDVFEALKVTVYYVWPCRGP